MWKCRMAIRTRRLTGGNRIFFKICSTSFSVSQTLSRLYQNFFSILILDYGRKVSSNGWNIERDLTSWSKFIELSKNCSNYLSLVQVRRKHKPNHFVAWRNRKKGHLGQKIAPFENWKQQFRGK